MKNQMEGQSSSTQKFKRSTIINDFHGFCFSVFIAHDNDKEKLVIIKLYLYSS